MGEQPPSFAATTQKKLMRVGHAFMCELSL